MPITQCFALNKFYYVISTCEREGNLTPPPYLLTGENRSACFISPDDIPSVGRGAIMIVWIEWRVSFLFVFYLPMTQCLGISAFEDRAGWKRWSNCWQYEENIV